MPVTIHLFANWILAAFQNEQRRKQHWFLIDLGSEDRRPHADGISGNSNMCGAQREEFSKNKHLERSMKHKLLKDKLTPNKDENNGDAKRQPFGVKDINNNMAYEAEESLSGGFWIFKPCTFLVKWQQNSSEALKLLHFT
ncbi:uncharacterized protein LOC119307775 [Triticum dicoccoides]|uniref:uncharacterized protein LOC119307775 n=1 Tax=Triticum dicoccoides TaxID=85692 RepID=UPI0018903CFF|nr:uncharacterized protein LOC119307775 [Triticum dicoccoides]XP_037439751.1 uncharacterized protein LOC119307775 [Triticum dicoccoides]XP_037439752.1 uncharacterized protein LOC119307775 [Triticum dicoccoides]XP_037439753.1 uncharacterized protein LOC119307775 [Triticum dicoccoides]XP_037439754.1 uncharacterized protein LOC119307775 [Triticum dicoccoides]